jgi:hypothetical protein
MTAARFGIPSRRLLVAAALCAGATSTVATGCKHDAKADEQAKLNAAPQPVELQWQDQPLEGIAGGVATPVTVKEGSAPLVYLTEQAQVVQVIDRTSNTLLGQAEVAPRSIVRVDERHGVVAGKETVFAGPLDPSHRYAIVVVPQGEAVVRSGRYQPVAPPRLEQKGPTGEASPPSAVGADATDAVKEPPK